MKLLSKISLSYFLNTLVLFIIGLFGIYFAVNEVISSSVRGQLRDTSKEIVLKIENGIIQESPPLVEIKEIEPSIQLKPLFVDTTIYMVSEKELESYKQLTTYKLINGKNYKITTRISLIEKEDLFSAILITLSIILSALMLILFYVNRKTAKKIFSVFYNNLNKLEKFSLQKNRSLELETSDIDEFNVLNNSLTSLSEKAIIEYRSLKEFSEDVSHELQTPVAVIKNRLELLMQKDIDQSEINSDIEIIHQNINRLDKLNRSLILLAKLETNEFFNPSRINLAEKINSIIYDYLDIAQAKKVELQSHIQSGCQIEMNENLLDILLQNLLSNSIKHNEENGVIIINLTDSELTIKNTGKEPLQKMENYFKRFSYDQKSENSLGLGLAIAKKICDLYKYGIEYSYDKPMHIIKVNFVF